MANDRRPLTSAEKNELWSSSAGMCSYEGCKKNLVLQAKSKRSNIGQIAHIIGHSNGGARHEFMVSYGFTKDTLEDLRNLTLMCYDHHKLIDDHPEKYPPDMLFAMKRKHEEFVKTRLDTSRKHLALVHKTMHSPTDEILLSENLSKYLVDCVSLQEIFENYTEDGWNKIKGRNSELLNELKELMSSHNGVAVEVFPLSHVPLLVHLGAIISDTIPVSIYQYDRQNGIWVYDTPCDEKSSIEAISPNIQINEKESKVLAISVSLSAPVHLDDINAVLTTEDYDHLDIGLQTPKVDAILYNEQVKNIQQIFKSTVESLNNKNRYDEIHLFYAGPAGLAVEIGRSINKNMWPFVNLYHYQYRESPRYQWAFKI
ncbi:HNH endonuclease [Bacillus anthracis]|uniref:SAVED domain-containing protein n=1 Tax=Bacillus cereus group TaxID=86661 RepID=UPI001925CC83|nr:SAVED domain-containing protein [Bacillus anthracis]MBL3854158.1 SAVED domain-containing protein [Bacillus cereus]MDR4406191.1 HNH endonuclease [Bacillus anthracis]